MNKKDGKDFEILVQMIECSISPESTIEHNVQMPLLNSREGHTTQCDIVIRTGKKPRETITIIEVQDRNKPVMPNDFRGWKEKLEEVGAQHLICVSRKEFSASIKEQAVMSGGSIRLITLKELPQDKLPIDFFKFSFEYKNFDITEFSLNLQIPESEIDKVDISRLKEIKINDEYFSLDKIELISPFLLCRNFFNPPKNIRDGTGKIIFDIKKNTPQPLYFFESELFTQIGFECIFDWTADIIMIPVSILSYEQDKDGILAWVIDNSFQSPKGFVSIKIPIIKDGEKYKIQNMLLNIPNDVEISLYKKSFPML